MVSDAGTGATLAPTLVVMAVVVALALLGLARVLSPRRKSRGASVAATTSDAPSALRPTSGQCASGLTAAASIVAAVLLYPWAAMAGAAPLLVLLEAALLAIIVIAGVLFARSRASR